MPPSAPAPAARGACPGVTAPMSAADGMLVRVRLPGGVISATGLIALADVASRWGSSIIELTSRANVQIRGIHPDAVDHASRALVAAGLADPDSARDGRRDVLGPPLAGHDPHALLDVTAIVAQIARELAQADGLVGLPPKFCVAVDDGGGHGVRTVPADIAFGAVRSVDGRLAVQVACGRALGRSGSAPTPTTTIEPGAIGAAALAAAEVAAALGARLTDGHIALVLARRSIERTVTPSPLPGNEVARIPIGVLAHPHPGRVTVGAAPFLGQTTPAALLALAHLADRCVGGVRLTPWRGAVLVGLDDASADDARRTLSAVGLASDPDDPGHRISACIGSPGCGASLASTTDAALHLRRLGGPERVHLSGCEKRCGAGAGSIVAGTDVRVADGRGTFTSSHAGVGS